MPTLNERFRVDVLLLSSHRIGTCCSGDRTQTGLISRYKRGPNRTAELGNGEFAA